MGDPGILLPSSRHPAPPTLGFNARIEVTGGATYELEVITSTLNFTTNAIGGFGSCSLSVPDLWTPMKVPYLSTIKVYWGVQLVWEGRIEDRGYQIGGGERSTSFTCLGFRGILDGTSLRRVWSTRSQRFEEIPGGDGTTIGNAAITKTRNLTATPGQFDPTDPTKSGVQVTGAGTSIVDQAGNGLRTLAPIGVTWEKARATVVLTSGQGLSAKIVAFDEAGSSTADQGISTGTLNWAITGAQEVRFILYNATGSPKTPTATGDFLQVYDLRLLGTSLDEDVTGGFYGGTLLADVIALCPDLMVGLIEQGSDFTIQQLDYGVRAAASQIVNAIASFYAREWAVWDNKQFFWKAPRLDEAQWTVLFNEADAINIKGSVDGITRTGFVLYTDAASGRTAEQSASSSDRRNPFARQAVTKDELIAAPALMTENTAAQLAARAIDDHGAWPPVSGQIVIPAEQMIRNAIGSALPAFMIRAGANVSIPELPKSDLFAAGRDGETFFRVVSTEADMSAGKITLQIEGQSRYLDVLTARLAEATRVLIGG